MPRKAVNPMDRPSLEKTEIEAKEENPLAHVSEAKKEEIYSLAYTLYQKQLYPEATHFFRLLLVADESEAKYWKGLGACLQMQKNHEEALNCYLYAQTMQQDSPDLYLDVYAADCYFALEQIEAGLKALNTAQIHAEKRQDLRVLQHVALMRKLWSKS